VGASEYYELQPGPSPLLCCSRELWSWDLYFSRELCSAKAMFFHIDNWIIRHNFHSY
jgi:hypothetical protein